MITPEEREKMRLIASEILRTATDCLADEVKNIPARHVIRLLDELESYRWVPLEGMAELPAFTKDRDFLMLDTCRVWGGCPHLMNKWESDRECIDHMLHDLNVTHIAPLPQGPKEEGNG